MQAPQIEIVDVQPNVLPESIKKPDVRSARTSITNGSKKATFRRFIAENALQNKARLEATMEESEIGSLNKWYIIEPSKEKFFQVVNCFKFKITIQNKTNSKINAFISIDEGVTLLWIGKEGSSYKGFELENSDQTIAIDTAFLKQI